MHSTTVRIQNVFGFFTTVSFFVALLTALSVVLYPATPQARVDVVNVKVIKGRPNYYASKQQEYAFITFDLDADLSSLYNWNTKQVFCWLSVVYPGAGRPTKHVSSAPLPPRARAPLTRADRQRGRHLGRDPAGPRRRAPEPARREGEVQRQRHRRPLPRAQRDRALRLERAAARRRARLGQRRHGRGGGRGGRRAGRGQARRRLGLRVPARRRKEEAGGGGSEGGGVGWGGGYSLVLAIPCLLGVLKLGWQRQYAQPGRG